MEIPAEEVVESESSGGGKALTMKTRVAEPSSADAIVEAGFTLGETQSSNREEIA